MDIHGIYMLFVVYMLPVSNKIKHYKVDLSINQKFISQDVLPIYRSITLYSENVSKFLPRTLRTEVIKLIRHE